MRLPGFVDGFVERRHVFAGRTWLDHRRRAAIRRRRRPIPPKRSPGCRCGGRRRPRRQGGPGLQRLPGASNVHPIGDITLDRQWREHQHADAGAMPWRPLATSGRDPGPGARGGRYDDGMVLTFSCRCGGREEFGQEKKSLASRAFSARHRGKDAFARDERMTYSSDLWIPFTCAITRSVSMISPQAIFRPPRCLNAPVVHPDNEMPFASPPEKGIKPERHQADQGNQEAVHWGVQLYFHDALLPLRTSPAAH